MAQCTEEDRKKMEKEQSRIALKIDPDFSLIGHPYSCYALPL